MTPAQDPSQFFEPTQAQVSQLVLDLCDPALSLIDLARKYSTTLEALTLFLSRSDIQERLANLENMAAERTRLTASFKLDTCVSALGKIVEEFTSTPPLFKKREPGQPPQEKPSDRQLTLHLRTNDLITKAAACLYRLSRFTPLPRRRQRPDIYLHQRRADATAHPAGTHHPFTDNARVSSRPPVAPAHTGDAEIDALIQELQSVAHQRSSAAPTPSSAPAEPDTDTELDPELNPEPELDSDPELDPEANSNHPSAADPHAPKPKHTCVSQTHPTRSELADPKSSSPARLPTPPQHPTPATPHPTSPASTAWP